MMKVPGSDGNSEILKRVQEGAVNERSVQRKAKAEAGANAAGAEGLMGELAKAQGDTFTVSSLGARIREELDPAKMAAERRAKIESLKEQIRNGTYAPPLQEVAQSVGEEISLEVLFSGGVLKGE
jgi:hypothetical protein